MMNPRRRSDFQVVKAIDAGRCTWSCLQLALTHLKFCNIFYKILF